MPLIDRWEFLPAFPELGLLLLGRLNVSFGSSRYSTEGCSLGGDGDWRYVCEAGAICFNLGVSVDWEGCWEAVSLDWRLIILSLFRWVRLACLGVGDGDLGSRELGMCSSGEGDNPGGEGGEFAGDFIECILFSEGFLRSVGCLAIQLTFRGPSLPAPITPL